MPLTATLPRRAHVREPVRRTASTASSTASGATPANPRRRRSASTASRRNGRDFDVLAEALAATHRVLAVDMPGRGESEWLADPADYGFPTYLDDADGADRPQRRRARRLGRHVDGRAARHGRWRRSPNSPIARLVVNDVGPVIEPAALARIGTYVGARPDVRDASPRSRRYIRAISAPFGPLTDAQWEHLTAHQCAPARRRPLGARLRPGDRGAVSRQRRRRPTCGGCGTRSAARRWCCAARDSDLLSAATAAAMTGRGPRPRRDRVRRRRPRADAARPGAGRTRSSPSCARPCRRRGAWTLRGGLRASRRVRHRLQWKRRNNAAPTMLHLSLPPIDAHPANPPETRPAKVKAWLDDNCCST